MNNEVTKEVLNRKKLEEQANTIKYKNRQLKEQKKQLQAIINNVGNLLLVLDSKGKYIYKNKLAEKYFIRGILERYGGNRNSNRFFDINRNVIRKEDLPYRIVLRTKEIDKRVIIIKREEKEIYLQTTTVPVLDDKGDIDMVIFIATDVTIHIKHSKIIQQQKEELEIIVENMSEGLAVIDKNGKYVRVNKKVKENTEKSTKFVKVVSNVGESFNMGEKYYDMEGKLISRDDFPSAKVLRGEKIENERVVVKQGDITYYFDFSGNSIFNKNGEVRLGVILVRDVTQQVQSQNLITEQKEQLQAVIENINEAIFIYDKDSKLYALNKLAKDYFPNENLKQYADGYSYTKFFYLDNSEIPKEEMPFTKIKNGWPVNNYKAKMIQGDIVRYINVSGRPVYRSDKSIGLSVISSSDITEDINKECIIKEQQDLILKKDREQIEFLKSSLEMKDEFLSLIAHEFKTPLNVINTAIQAMKYLCGSELSDKGKKYLGMIKQNTFRQLRLVNNLLDITRADAGRIKINKKNLDIVFLTKSITESVHSYASNKGVKLSFIPSAKKKLIGIDNEKYERILLNLLSNAIKFTTEGKYIIVNLTFIKGKVCIKFKDTGIGIPPDKIDVIFERFGQVDSLLSRQAEGTGIGLSLVKRFVESLGGSISVKSKVGVGYYLCHSTT